MNGKFIFWRISILLNSPLVVQYDLVLSTTKYQSKIICCPLILDMAINYCTWYQECSRFLYPKVFIGKVNVKITYKCLKLQLPIRKWHFNEPRKNVYQSTCDAEIRRQMHLNIIDVRVTTCPVFHFPKNGKFHLNLMFHKNSTSFSASSNEYGNFISVVVGMSLYTSQCIVAELVSYYRRMLKGSTCHWWWRSTREVRKKSMRNRIFYGRKNNRNSVKMTANGILGLIMTIRDCHSTEVLS